MFSFFQVRVLAQDTQGFFLDGIEPHPAVIPDYTEYDKPVGTSPVTITVDYTSAGAVPGLVYGNNANIWMTQMVNQPTLLDHIEKLNPQVLRFPGGNNSSIYFWNSEVDDPPADAPAQLLDANGNAQSAGYWYGKNAASWTCSVDSYYQMLEMTENQGIITINYGYARYSTAPDPVASAAHLAADWVRYDNGRTKYWEIGNESGGSWQAGYRIDTNNNQDGQPAVITGAIYGSHFKVFADSMRKAADEVGATIYIGAQLLAEAPLSWWNDTDRYWNQGVFQNAGDTPDYYIIHSYYTPYQTDSSPSEILNTAATASGSMMDYVTSSMTADGVQVKPVALTEWNIFAEGSMQQVSYIAGMHAAMVLGELIKNKYGLACRWDLANGWGGGNDHGMFSQGGEPGVPMWNPRPAFYYMYYFENFFGDHLINSSVSGSSDIICYASRFSSGEVGAVIVNKGTSDKVVKVYLENTGYGDRFYFYSLTGGSDNGQFSRKVKINDVDATYPGGGPANFQDIKARSATLGDGVRLTAASRSVNYVIIETGENIITETSSEPKEITVKVYPNPTSNSFRIDFPLDGFSRLSIVDTQGLEIYEQRIDPARSTTEIRTTLKPGLYILRLTGKRGPHQARVIIE